MWVSKQKAPGLTFPGALKFDELHLDLVGIGAGLLVSEITENWSTVPKSSQTSKSSGQISGSSGVAEGLMAEGGFFGQRFQ